jgi:hypothetical protein
MFHSVCKPSTKVESEWYITKTRFARFNRWLVDNKYYSLMSSDWFARDHPGPLGYFHVHDGYDDFYTERFRSSSGSD